MKVVAAEAERREAPWNGAPGAIFGNGSPAVNGGPITAAAGSPV